MGTTDALCQRCKQPFKASGLVPTLCAWCRAEQRDENQQDMVDTAQAAEDYLRSLGRGAE